MLWSQDGEKFSLECPGSRLGAPGCDGLDWLLHGRAEKGGTQHINKEIFQIGWLNHHKMAD